MKTSTQFFLSLFLSFLWLFPIGAQAEKETIGELKYELVAPTGTNTKGTATVMGYTENVPAALEIPVTVTKEGVTYDVVAIGEGAFVDATLTSATLNGNKNATTTSLKSVGKYAFKGTGLTSVTFENATSLERIEEGAFEDCTALASVVLTEADELKSIGKNAFKGIALETVDLSWFTGLTEIGAGAFAESGVVNLWLPESLTKIEEGAFQDCDELIEAKFLQRNNGGTGDGKNLASIGKNAFNGCIALETVTLTGAANLDSIGEGAFENCTALASVVLTGAESLTKIGDNAFAGIGLKTVDLSWFSSLTEIGAGAFAGSDVENLWLPESLTKIGVGAFQGCTALTEALFQKKDGSGNSMVLGDGKNLETIEDNAFNGCGNLAKVVLTNATSLTTIGAGAFKGTGLADVTLTEVTSLTEIGANAFENSGLTALDFVLVNATNLTIIGENAFAGSTKMESVKLPENLTEIGDNAFNGCTTLATVTLTSPTPPELGAGAFAGAGSSATTGGPEFKVEGSASIGDYLANGDWAESFAVPATDIKIDAATLLKFIIEETGTDAKAIIIGYDGTVTEPLVIPPTLTVTDGTSTVIATVTTIAAGAFEGLTGLTGVTFPENLTTIGAGAFKGCSDLKFVEFKSVNPPSVGEDAFEGIAEDPNFGCPTGYGNKYRNDPIVEKFFSKFVIITEASYDGTLILVEVAVKASVTRLAIPIVSDTRINKNAFEGITHPITLVFQWATPPPLIGEGTIPDYITFECPKGYLSAYQTSDWWTYFALPVYDFTFTTAEEGTGTEVVRTATVMGVTATDKTSVTEITLPEVVIEKGKAYTITAIGDGAFADLTNLTTFTLESTTPPTLGADVFKGVDIDAVTFKSPNGTLDDYLASDWAPYFKAEPTPEPTPEPEPEPIEPAEPGTGDGGARFRVTFLQGDEVLYQTTVHIDSTIPAAIVPVLEEREGYTLFWFAVPDSSAIWDFSTPVTAVLTLSPVWILNEDEDEDDEDDDETSLLPVSPAPVKAALYDLRGQLLRHTVVTFPATPATLRNALGVPGGLYILATPEGSRKIKL